MVRKKQEKRREGAEEIGERSGYGSSSPRQNVAKAISSLMMIWIHSVLYTTHCNHLMADGLKKGSARLRLSKQQRAAKERNAWPTGPWLKKAKKKKRIFLSFCLRLFHPLMHNGHIVWPSITLGV